MDRNRKVVFVAHPILNQHATPSGKERSQGVVKEIIEVISESGVGMIQMAPVEIDFNGGLDWKLKNKDQMDTKKFRKICRDHAKVILKQAGQYMEKNYTIVGILGVESSPTWAVHQIENGHRRVPGRGILMEEIEDEMKKKRFQIPLIGVDLNNTFGSAQKLKMLLGE